MAQPDLMSWNESLKSGFLGMSSESVLQSTKTSLAGQIGADIEDTNLSRVPERDIGTPDRQKKRRIDVELGHLPPTPTSDVDLELIPEISSDWETQVQNVTLCMPSNELLLLLKTEPNTLPNPRYISELQSNRKIDRPEWVALIASVTFHTNLYPSHPGVL